MNEEKHLRASRLGWTFEEIQFVKHMKEVMNENSWAVIAKKLKKNFPEKQRTSKQCRELYINSVKLQLKKGEWTDQQIKIMVHEFQVNGPKWILISRLLPGRSENCVKNKFYGSLRKLIRKVNEAMRSNTKKQQKKMKKPIKLQSVMKIFDLSNSGFQLIKEQSKLNNLINLKHDLLNQIVLKIEQISDQKLISLAERIYNFNCQTRFLGPAKNKITSSFRKINRISKDRKKICSDPRSTNEAEQNQSIKDLSTQKSPNNLLVQLKSQFEFLWPLEQNQKQQCQIIPNNRFYEQERDNFIKQIFNVPEQDNYYLLFG